MEVAIRFQAAQVKIQKELHQNIGSGFLDRILRGIKFALKFLKFA